MIPYFGYARQDRRPRAARVPITAKLVANLVHQNIVQIHHLGRHEDGYYIAREFIDGIKPNRIDTLKSASFPNTGACRSSRTELPAEKRAARPILPGPVRLTADRTEVLPYAAVRCSPRRFRTHDPWWPSTPVRTATCWRCSAS